MAAAGHATKSARAKAPSQEELERSRRLSEGVMLESLGGESSGSGSSRVAGAHHGVDPAAHVEVTLHSHAARCDLRHEVVEDPIRHGLVEVPLVAEGPQIELEALQLDTLGLRHVADADRREVRLPGLRAQTGELRALEVDLVVPLGGGQLDG